MLDTKGLLTVKQYSKHRKVSRHTVYKYIRNGKIQQSVYTVDGKTMIDPDQADRELSENLDQIHNPKHRTKTDQAARLKIQDKAVDVASTGETETGELIPWPVWAAKYIAALDTLDPERIRIELNNDDGREQWRLTVDEINTETERAAPWAVTMEFDFNPNLAEG